MIRLAVSTPTNSKGKASGYRVFEYSNGILNPLSTSTNVQTEKDNIIQKFCYLKPRNRQISPECLNGGIVDSSDYLLIIKSNGLIEVVRDYQYKLENKQPLTPNFILTCIPINSSHVLNQDLSVAGIEYRDGLLYCCTCYGDLYIFVLNLPSDYIQVDNLHIQNCASELFFHQEIPPNRELQSLEEATFHLHSKFTGRTKLKHICYYLMPMGYSISLAYHLQTKYPGISMFKETIYVNLKKNISNFHINPLDRFSIITIAPRTPLTIHKLQLPKSFVDYFIALIGLKKSIVDSAPEEIKDIDESCRKVHKTSLYEYLKYNPVSQIDTDADPMMWNSLMANNCIAELTSIAVWRQKQGQLKDEIYELFHGCSDDKQRLSEESRERPVSRGTNSDIRSSSLRRDILTRAIDAPSYSNSVVDKFIRDLRRNTCPVDFKIVKTSPRSNTSNDRDLINSDSTVTSFLTDNYRDMDIIAIDKFLTLTAFRPKYVDEPLMKIDSFYSSAELFHDREVDYETCKFQQALSNFSSFKKLFMINNCLCLIFDTHGVLLVDRYKISNHRNLLANRLSSLKVIDFDIGLINDVAVLVREMNICDDCDDDLDVTFEAFVTCVSGEIKALHGKFYKHKRLGEMNCRDCLKINRKNKFADQILLLSYDTDLSRKRKRDEFLVKAGNSKKTRR